MTACGRWAYGHELKTHFKTMSYTLFFGGEAGIRTLGAQRTHLISSQARSTNSGTSPGARIVVEIDARVQRAG